MTDNINSQEIEAASQGTPERKEKESVEPVESFEEMIEQAKDFTKYIAALRMAMGDTPSNIARKTGKDTNPLVIEEDGQVIAEGASAKKVAGAQEKAAREGMQQRPEEPQSPEGTAIPVTDQRLKYDEEGRLSGVCDEKGNPVATITYEGDDSSDFAIRDAKTGRVIAYSGGPLSGADLRFNPQSGEVILNRLERLTGGEFGRQETRILPDGTFSSTTFDFFERPHRSQTWARGNNAFEPVSESTYKYQDSAGQTTNDPTSIDDSRPVSREEKRDGQSKVEYVYENMEAVKQGKKPIDMNEMERAAEAIYKACNGGLTGAGTNKDVVYEILKGKTEAERKVMDDLYQKKYQGMSLEGEFRDEMQGADLDKALNLLYRKDAKVDYAGRIHAALLERGQAIEGRSDETCEKDIRDTLAMMNSEQIRELSREYAERYGKSLTDALISDPNLSEATKDAISIYLKGTDRRTTRDTLRLADIALKAKDIDMFQEAMRSATPEARKSFIDKSGEEKLKAAFGSAAVDEKGNVHYGETPALKVAQDYAQHGKLSTDTKVELNTSWAGDNEKAIEQSVADMRYQECKDYLDGRDLVERAKMRGWSDEEKAKGWTEEEKTKVQTYTELNRRLTAAGNETEVAQWEGQMARSLISKMSEADWKQLKEVPDYRKEIDRALGSYLNAAEMKHASSVLDGMQRAETFKEAQASRQAADAAHNKAPELGIVQKLAVHATDESEPGAVIRDISKAFADDPTLRERIRNPQTAEDKKFSGQFRNILSEALDADDIKEYVDPLLETGHLAIDLQMELNNGWDDDEQGAYKDLVALANEGTTQAESERDRLLNEEDYQDQVLHFLDDEERKVALYALRQRAMLPEDVIRSHLLGAGTGEEEVKQALAALTPEQIDRVKKDYARKYGEDLQFHLLDEMGDQDAVDASRLTRGKGTVAEELNEARDEAYASRDGLGGSLVDTAWDGTGYMTDDAVNKLSAAMAKSSAEFKDLSPEEQKALTKQIQQNLDLFRESKGAAADMVVDAAIIAAGIGGAGFTGGVSLGLLAKTAAAGAAFKVAAKSTIMGSDYDWASSQVVVDALTGGVDAASIVVGPAQLAQVLRMGKAAAATATDALLEGGEQLLKAEASEKLGKKMFETVASAISNGAEEVDDKAIKALAREFAQEGQEEALEAEIRKSLREAMEKEARSTIRRTVDEIGLNTAAGTIGGGGAGAVRGAAEWDESKSVTDNFLMVAESTIASAGMGAGMAGVFSTAFGAAKIAGDSLRAEVPAISPDSDVLVNGQRLSANGEPIHIGNTSFEGAPVEVSQQHLSMARDDEGRMFLLNHSNEGTFVKREGSDKFERVPAGTPIPIGAGDEVRLGSETGPKLDLQATPKAADTQPKPESGRIEESAPGPVSSEAQPTISTEGVDIEGTSLSVATRPSRTTAEEPEGLWTPERNFFGKEISPEDRLKLLREIQIKPDNSKLIGDKPANEFCSLLESTLADEKVWSQDLSRSSSGAAEILKQRTEQLQGMMNQFADKTGLPPVKIKVVNPGELGAGSGMFSSNGELLISQNYLRSRQHMVRGAEILYHEFGHNEQHALVIRAVADKLNIGRSATRDQMQQLKHEYLLSSTDDAKLTERLSRRSSEPARLRQEIGKYDSVEEFLDKHGSDPEVKKAIDALVPDKRIQDVLEKRDGAHLTQAEQARADRLAESFTRNAPPDKMFKELGQRHGKVQAVYLELLNSDDPYAAGNLLEKLSQENDAGKQLRQALFGKDEIPANYQRAIDSWREAKESNPLEPWSDAKEAAIRKSVLGAMSKVMTDINTYRKSAYENYMAVQHEKEGFLLGQQVLKKMLYSPAAAESTGRNATPGGFAETTTAVPHPVEGRQSETVVAADGDMNLDAGVRPRPRQADQTSPPDSDPQIATMLAETRETLRRGVEMDEAEDWVELLRETEDPIITVEMQHLNEILQKGVMTVHEGWIPGVRMFVGSLGKPPENFGGDRFMVRVINPNITPRPRATGPDDLFHGTVCFDQQFMRLGQDFEIILPDGTIIRRH